MDGARKDDGLTYTPTKQWADASVYWSGVVGPGSHTAWLQSPQANVWGCHGPSPPLARLFRFPHHLLEPTREE